MLVKTKQVFWEWVPGPAAGLLPLCIFWVDTLFTLSIDLPNGHPNVHHDGWIGHWLVLAVVTSTVSTFTSYPRLFAFRLAGEPIGNASLGLVMVNTLILVFSATLYTIHEQHRQAQDMIWSAFAAAIAAAAISLWLEFAIANLKLRHEANGLTNVAPINLTNGA